MHATQFAPPTVAAAGNTDPAAPLVVLLHGRGSRETDIIGLATALPEDLAFAAVRAPIGEGDGFAWFANRGIGRPIAESLRDTMQWFNAWLDGVAPPGRPVLLVGFSGGAAFAGGLALDHPERFAGAAILYGTMPFDAGLDTGPGRLAALPMFVAQGENDHVIPTDLQQRTWRYLHGDSGAATSSHRDDAGHGLSRAAVQRLGDWLHRRTAWLAEHGPQPVGAPPVEWPTFASGALPRREGEPPEVSTQTPQQQLTMNAPDELQERLFHHVLGLAGVATQPSVISVPGARAFVLDPEHAVGPDASFIVPQVREFAHLHPDYDGSLHVALPQPFAADAVAKGWSITHPLAGLLVPPGMVLLFGPRDERELGVVTSVLDAAHMFATAQEGT